MSRCRAILLGRRTYETFEPAWSGRTAEDDPGAPFFNDTPKHVVSSTLEDATWRNSRLLGPYDAGAIRRVMEEAGGDLFPAGPSGNERSPRYLRRCGRGARAYPRAMWHVPAWFRRAARSLLLGARGLVAFALAAFVVVLAFANHPWFAGAVAAVTVLAAAFSERARRHERRVRDAARVRRALE